MALGSWQKNKMPFVISRDYLQVHFLVIELLSLIWVVFMNKKFPAFVAPVDDHKYRSYFMGR